MPAPACQQAALDYLQRGWSPIPLCPPSHEGCSDGHLQKCQRPGKGPARAWKPFQTRKATVAEIKGWYKSNPQFNVGVVFGTVSGIVGLDIDGPVAEGILEDISAGDKPPTLRFRTPAGGRRLIYALPEGHPPIRKARWDDGDSHVILLGEGSYSVMPPSVHPSGKKYAKLVGKLKPAPAWILALTKEEGEAVGVLPGGESQADARQIYRARRYLAKCDPCVEGQNGSGKATLIAARLIHGFHLPVETALGLVLSEYNDTCQPPWTEEEWRHKLTWVAQHGYGESMGAPKAKPKGGIITLSADAVEEGTAEWIMYGWFPRSALTTFDGDPDLGKSTVLVDIAARLSRGGPMPDGEFIAPGNALIITGEDSIERTVIKRVRAANADESRITFLKGVIGDDGKERPLEIPGDLELLDSVIEEKDVQLVIFDPFSGFLCGPNANRDWEIRRVLCHMAAIAERRNCAMVLMRHLNKSGGENAMYRGNMSIAVIGMARSGILIAQHPDEPDKRVMASIKCNIGAKPDSLKYGFQTVDDRVRIAWEGTTHLQAKDLLKRPLDDFQAETQQDQKTQKEECRELLIENLADGPKPVKELKALCREVTGASDKTAMRAARSLDIEKFHEILDGKRVYFWKLPETDEN